jgi:hypothetical protein
VALRAAAVQERSRYADSHNIRTDRGLDAPSLHPRACQTSDRVEVQDSRDCAARRYKGRAPWQPGVRVAAGTQKLSREAGGRLQSVSDMIRDCMYLLDSLG